MVRREPDISTRSCTRGKNRATLSKKEGERECIGKKGHVILPDRETSLSTRQTTQQDAQQQVEKQVFNAKQQEAHGVPVEEKKRAMREENNALNHMRGT